MGRKKESKPLLNKSNTAGGQITNPNTLSVKKIQKGKPGKPKLSSVSEGSISENSGDNSGGKEMRSNEKCLEKDVDESIEEGNDSKLKEAAAEGKSCSHSFGVRSYLHHFYESVNNQNTSGQEEEYHYLIHPKGRRCGAIWFKIGLIMGATLFLLGAVAIVIGYAIPKQKVILGRSGDLEVIDNDARRFNENLDRCKLIGLAGFCSGGLVLVISLLAPTFTSTYWDDDPAIEPFRVSLSSNLMTEAEPKSPIPVTENIKCIQPVWIN